MESEFDWHGGEIETSTILAVRPELVKMDQIDETSGKRLGRLEHLPGVYPGQETPISWYANFPDHYAGDARTATAEKGKRLLQYRAQHLAKLIKAVKEDRAAGELYDEFFGRTQH